TFISEKEQNKFKTIEDLLGHAVTKTVVPEQFGPSPEYHPGGRGGTGGRGRGRGRGPGGPPGGRGGRGGPGGHGSHGGGRHIHSSPKRGDS
ncbi:MAG TPA: hypothetical protein VG052_08950, partial [Puia sp.]|nr:hypothetical protein [Puia sp.]